MYHDPRGRHPIRIPFYVVHPFACIALPLPAAIDKPLKVDSGSPAGVAGKDPFVENFAYPVPARMRRLPEYFTWAFESQCRNRFIEGLQNGSALRSQPLQNFLPVYPKFRSTAAPCSMLLKSRIRRRQVEHSCR